MDPARDDAGLKAEGLDLFRAFGFSYVGYSMTKPPVLPGALKTSANKLVEVRNEAKEMYS